MSENLLLWLVIGGCAIAFVLFLIFLFSFATASNGMIQTTYEKKRSIQDEYEWLQLGMSFEEVQNTLSTLK